MPPAYDRANNHPKLRQSQNIKDINIVLTRFIKKRLLKMLKIGFKLQKEENIEEKGPRFFIILKKGKNTEKSINQIH